MDNLLGIAILVFLSAFLAVNGMFMFISSLMERRAVLEKIRHDRVPAPPEVDDGSEPGQAPAVSPLVRLSMRLGRLTKPKDENEIGRQRLLFLRAGYRHHSTPVLFLGLRFLVAPVLPAGYYLLHVSYLHWPLTYVISGIVILTLVGFNLPLWWVKKKGAMRREKIMEGFPDALDLLVVCVEAGMGLDSAISRVAAEMELVNTPISDEFRLLTMELRAGRTRRDALRNLAVRTDLEDVGSLVTLIIQTDKFGTSVGPALRVLSDSMRTKRYQRAEERAAKIPTKLVFPLLLCIFPSMFIIFLAPPLIQLFRMWKHTG